jgi:hypothetical protein
MTASCLDDAWGTVVRPFFDNRHQLFRLVSQRTWSDALVSTVWSSVYSRIDSEEVAPESSGTRSLCRRVAVVARGRIGSN